MSSGNKIIENLYLSNLGHANNNHRDYGYVLSLVNPGHHLDFDLAGEQHMKLFFMDYIESSILPHINPCVDFIHKGLEDNQKVLVHCQQGVSRSSSIIIAYLIKKKGMSFREAYLLTKSKRKIIKPNPTFFKELKTLCPNEIGFCDICFAEMDHIKLKIHQCKSPKCSECGVLYDFGKLCQKKCFVCNKIIDCTQLKNHLIKVHKLQVP